MPMLGFFHRHCNRMLILLGEKTLGCRHIKEMLEPALKTRLCMLFQLRLGDNLCRICCYHEPDAPPPPNPPPPPPKPPPPKPPRPLPLPRPPPAKKACKISWAIEVINKMKIPAPIIRLATKPKPFTNPAAVPATAAVAALRRLPKIMEPITPAIIIKITLPKVV